MADQPEDATNAQNFDFGKKKKKKTTTKKTKEETVEKEESTKQPQQDNEDEETHKHLETAPEDDDTTFEDEETVKQESAETSKVLEPIKFASDKDYAYEELARRIFSLINAARPEEKTVYKMKPPVVYREGASKTVWVNFPEICKIMSRQPDHVLSFVLAEVGSTGSIDGSARLVIKGKFQPKHIENILRRYIAEYVKCHTCKSPETVLRKENRLLFMVCEKCGSSRSVSAIKSGFQATTRASRRAAAAQKI